RDAGKNYSQSALFRFHRRSPGFLRPAAPHGPFKYLSIIITKKAAARAAFLTVFTPTIRRQPE
ncbi:MAG: hypothetical protein IKY07_02255, partial [Clostridia bacterium]|nr:hypothetical protein [Clostridia bacterium]